MSIVCECEHCGRQFEVADNLAGKRARCKQCGRVFRIPALSGPTAAEIYALDAQCQPSEPIPPEPPSPIKGAKKKKSKAKVSGLVGLRALPLWGFNVYRGAIAALLGIALLVGGVPEFVLGLAGMFLCVWPFVVAGFIYRFGVAFRDGPIAGLLYMFVLPYRIHYRLTHRELFERLRIPTLTFRDFSLLLMGLCFLPVVIVSAKEMDKLNQKRGNEIDWTQFVGPRGKNAGPPPAAPKHAVKPPLLGWAKPPTRTHRPPEPERNDAAVAESEPSGQKAVEPSAPEGSSRQLADSEKRSAGRGSTRPGSGDAARLERAPRRPFSPRSGQQSALSAFPPEATVTITVHGAADRTMREQWNQSLIAIVKPAGGEWRVSVSVVEGNTIFTVCPISDPVAFSDKIDFGKVTRVDGRSIEVEAGR